jgi:N-acetylglucosamine transport system permease protein
VGSDRSARTGKTAVATGLILVYIAYSLPFTVFFLAAFFKTSGTTIRSSRPVRPAA